MHAAILKLVFLIPLLCCFIHTSQAACSDFTSCGQCTGSGSCIWCEHSGTFFSNGSSSCVDGGILGGHNVSLTCANFFYKQCTVSGELFGNQFTYLIILCALGLVASCAIVAPIAYMIHKRHLRNKTESEADVYEMDEERPTRKSEPGAAPSKPLPDVAKADKSRNSVMEGVSKLCNMCRTAKKDTVLLPCGHLMLCEFCAADLVAQGEICPACKQNISGHTKVIIL